MSFESTKAPELVQTVTARDGRDDEPEPEYQTTYRDTATQPTDLTTTRADQLRSTESIESSSDPKERVCKDKDDELGPPAESSVTR